VFHTIVSIKNDGHYFCRAGGNRPDGLNEPVTFIYPGQSVRQVVAVSAPGDRDSNGCVAPGRQ
ncbi:hypothetical protein FNN22_25200, partial [Escherichia coli]|nr:hypothetical protein [Escherichia coli]